MSSKIIGGMNADFFAALAVDAVLAVKREETAVGVAQAAAAAAAEVGSERADRDGEKTKAGPKYPVSSINVLKTHGKSALESTLVHGYALNATRASQQMPRAVTGGARIALLDFNLQRHRMALGVQVR
jgi:T-complex protein 1 subunit alpha